MPFTIILNTQEAAIFLDWRQVLSYDVSFLNIRIVVNSVINLVNKNLPELPYKYVCFISITILRLLFLMRSII
jgi:hypothetical protein